MPPPAVWTVRIFYQNKNGDDMLDQKKNFAFKEKDLMVQTKASTNSGAIKLLSYDGSGIKVALNQRDLYLFNPSAPDRYFFFLAIPVKSTQTQPIETYVTVTPTDTDTVTYDFGINPQTTFYGNQYWHYPEKIYYNGKLSLEMSKKPADDPLISLFVTK